MIWCIRKPRSLDSFHYSTVYQQQEGQTSKNSLSITMKDIQGFCHEYKGKMWRAYDSHFKYNVFAPEGKEINDDAAWAKYYENFPFPQRKMFLGKEEHDKHCQLKSQDFILPVKGAEKMESRRTDKLQPRETIARAKYIVI